MAVFICAADESADAGRFFYGGFAASIDDWEQVFAPAWNERVLNGPPQIPYLHMTEIRDWDFQAKYGLEPWQADNRLDDASQVIRSTGALIPVIFSLSRKEFDTTLRQPFSPRPKQRATMDPDYICFQWFAFTQLDWIHTRYGDEVERVDFWIEENGKISRYMQEFHNELARSLNYIKRPELAKLVGRLRPIEKEQIPAQAADMLGWHCRNAARGKLDRVGWRRYWRMTEGGVPGQGRYGHRGLLDTDDLRQLAEGFAKFYVTPVSAGGGAA